MTLWVRFSLPVDTPDSAVKMFYHCIRNSQNILIHVTNVVDSCGRIVNLADSRERFRGLRVHFKILQVSFLEERIHLSRLETYLANDSNEDLDSTMICITRRRHHYQAE